MDNSRLLEEINQTPSNQRFFTGKGPRLRDFYCNDACVFGYGTYDDMLPLDNIPPETKGLYFYYGAGIKDLLQEILKLPIIQNLEYLTIGITHNNAQDYADYTAISAILSSVHFPNLKFFEYGIDELIVNEGRIYGNLGDITNVLTNTPRLEKIYLFGNFELTKPLILPHLTDLEVLLNDFQLNINGGKISNATLNNILSSKFETLRLLALDLDFNDTEFDYELPDVFLNGESTPAIKYIDLEGKFKAGTRSKIRNSTFLKRFFLNMKFSNDIKEPLD